MDHQPATQQQAITQTPGVQSFPNPKPVLHIIKMKYKGTKKTLFTIFDIQGNTGV